MDINLPGMSGIECTRALKQLVPYVEVIMLTMFGDLDRIFDALRAGASGYLLKRTSPAELKVAMEDVRIGGAPMSPYVARQIVEHFRQPHTAKPGEDPAEKIEQLSPRESEILKLLAEGAPYKEISDKLEIHIDTVRTHIRRIYRKLHVHSRMDAARKYQQLQKGLGLPDLNGTNELD
jgi:DNA-binding NarL/FixJ family response regulator